VHVHKVLGSAKSNDKMVAAFFFTTCGVAVLQPAREFIKV
jgi:hypothetical protein